MSSQNVPLVVDLDDALTHTDTLWESLFLSVRHHPARCLQFPLWLLRGKAGFKASVARTVLPDAALLPYNQAVLELLRTSQAEGRRIILATGANIEIANRVAEHLGFFSDVLASTNEVNLTGESKLKAVQELLGGAPFDYVGDHKAAAPLFEAARKSYLVAARLPKRDPRDFELLTNRTVGESRVTSLIRLLRPHQWAKNILLFIPIILAQEIGDLSRLSNLALAFFSFSFCASAGYIINDALDLEADRVHPQKRARPLASGAVPLWSVGPLLFIVGGLGGALGFWVGWEYLALVAGYLCLSLSYTLFFKRQAVIDVIFLGSLYTLRIFAGGVAADVEITRWMVAFSVFFFTSLGFLKRYTEVRGTDGKGVMKSRDYRSEDLTLLESLGSTSGLLAVLVFALYINSGAMQHYVYEDVLWAICPVLLYWISRVWLLAGRGELPHDPVVFALKDKASWRCAVVTGILLVLAAHPF